jgi:hypothetical protein
MGYDLHTLKGYSDEHKLRMAEARERTTAARERLTEVRDEGPSGETDREVYLAALNEGQPHWEAQNAASEHPGSDAWLDASQAYQAAMEAERHLDWGYFRANISGMGVLRELSMACGLMVESESPKWRPLDEFGLTSDAYFDMSEGDVEPNEGFQEYQAAQRRNLRHHGTAFSGLPVHKFCSNDGWVVTPEEIEAGLARMDMAKLDAAFTDRQLRRSDGDEGIREFFAGWLLFLSRAKEYGGFEVW